MKPLMICLLCLAGALPGTLSAQQRAGLSVLEIIDVVDDSRRFAFVSYRLPNQ